MKLITIGSLLGCFIALSKAAEDCTKEHPCAIYPGHEVLPNTNFIEPKLDLIPLKDLPTDFDWRINGNLINMLSQRATSTWCGSCWALSTVSMLSDRFRITYPQEFGLRALSAQVLLNCGSPLGVGTCLGGNLEKAMNFIIENGLTDETCMPYVGLTSSYNTFECTMCRTCTLDGSCKPVPNPKTFGLETWGMASGELEIVNQIYRYGPVACYMYSHTPEYTEYTGGIIEDSQNYNWKPYNYTHAVELVGFGTDNDTNTPYYIARNWAGTNWGENGFFRIRRGTNPLNIEWRCIYATPSKP